MILHLNNLHPNRRISRRYLEKRIVKVLNRLRLNRAELGVRMVADKEIAGLNRRYLGRRGPTDVLSFPMDSEDFLGDVVVSLDTAALQARKSKRPVREQAMILIIHGVLHLVGYDHVRMKDRIRMRKKERELCRLIGVGGDGLWI